MKSLEKPRKVDLLTSIDQLFMFMNILTNFHITKEYLTLVTNYIKLVLLLSRVEDRKVVIGLYRKTFNWHVCSWKDREVGEFLVGKFFPSSSLYMGDR